VIRGMLVVLVVVLRWWMLQTDRPHAPLHRQVHNSNEDQRGLVFSRLADGVQKLSSATPLREAASDFELQLPTPVEFGVMAPRYDHSYPSCALWPAFHERAAAECW
jgi:hypothetical protein